MEKNSIPELMSVTMTKIREMVDVNTIVGQPVSTPDGTTIIPVSKVSFGFAAGGTDYAGKHDKPEEDKNFGGGSGAAVNIHPVSFLVVSPTGVKLLPVAPPPGSAVDRAIEAVPALLEKVASLLGRKKGKEDDEEEKEL
ncbi:MAG: GerW family sporulation protein [Oscillospiraceae bacterium]|nr:GerW family sporulation protein [Oscillospiraceae bacterium]